MDKSWTRILVVLGLIGGLSLTPSAQTKSAPPFQADFVTYYKLPDGRVVNSAGYYYRNSRGQVREDSGTSGQIIDLNARTVTMLNHQSKSAVVYKIPAMDVLPNAQAAMAPAPRPVPFARGVLEGHRVTKAKMLGPGGSKHEVWTADDLGIVVMRRTEAGNSTTTKTFRNLRTTEPDPAVFEIPPGYSVTTTPIDASAVLGGPGVSGRGRGRGSGGKPAPFDRR